MLKRSQKKNNAIDLPVVNEPKTSSTVNENVESTSAPSEHRHTFIISMFSILGALALGILFFTTGISEKIVHANQMHPRIVQVPVPTPEPVIQMVQAPTPAVSTSPTLPTSDFSKKDMIDYLNKLSEQDAERLFETIQENKRSSTSVKSSQLPASSLYEGIVSSRIDTKERALSELQGMSDQDVQTFLQHIVASNKESFITAANPLQKTLDDAYNEAERRYPGQVHASKRLKLIADRNVASYLYYVAEPGDTLLTLSRSFKTPLGQLVELNGISDADIIRAGEVLLFPSDTKQP